MIVELKGASERRVQTAWEAYTAAQAKAQRTLDMADGFEAGRLWREWLELFISHDQRAYLAPKGRVVPFQRGGSDVSRRPR